MLAVVAGAEFEHVEIVPKDRVDERNRQARAEFERICIIRYGYVPFNEEFFERTWPNGNRGTDAAVPEVRDDSGHDA